ncbi:MAG: hypothetical protein RLZZ597_962 [Cyanobacteriota bacterium]
MSLLHQYWKPSLLLGSVSLVGLAAFGTLQISPAIGASTDSTPNRSITQPQGNPTANPLLSQGQSQGMGQGRGQGQGQGMGQGRGQGQGHGQGNGPGNGQGQGPRGERLGEHLAEAAAELGATEDALRSALGVPDQRPERPDLATAAAQLGTTEDELRETMHNFMQTQRQARQGQGPQAGPPNFTALAQQYGVSEAEFRRIMGIPDRPDLAAAAAQLGVSEDALREALRPDHQGRGPAGAPGQGHDPMTHPGNSDGGR